MRRSAEIARGESEALDRRIRNFFRRQRQQQQQVATETAEEASEQVVLQHVKNAAAAAADSNGHNTASVGAPGGNPSGETPKTRDDASSGVGSMVHSDQEEEEEDVMEKFAPTATKALPMKRPSDQNSDCGGFNEISTSLNIGVGFLSGSSAGSSPESAVGSPGDAFDGGMRMRRRDRHHSFGALTALVKEQHRRKEKKKKKKLQHEKESSALMAAATERPTSDDAAKRVRFVDSLGLELVKVKVIDDDGDDDSNDDEDNEILNSSRRRIILLPFFPQPGGRPDFLDQVYRDRVALENAYADPVDGVSVRGIVRVLNLDYHKAVYIRWTLNEWRSMVDYRATYLKGSNDGATDIFTFKIYAPLDLGQSLVFAVRFHCVGEQFWDNNGGRNYRFVSTTVGSDEAAEAVAISGQQPGTYPNSHQEVEEDPGIVMRWPH